MPAHAVVPRGEDLAVEATQLAPQRLSLIARERRAGLAERPQFAPQRLGVCAQMRQFVGRDLARALALSDVLTCQRPRLRDRARRRRAHVLTLCRGRRHDARAEKGREGGLFQHDSVLLTVRPAIRP